MEATQPASKTSKITNRGTFKTTNRGTCATMSFADVVKEKIIAVIYQNDEGGKIPRNQ